MVIAYIVILYRNSVSVSRGSFEMALICSWNALSDYLLAVKLMDVVFDSASVFWDRAVLHSRFESVYNSLTVVSCVTSLWLYIFACWFLLISFLVYVVPY